MNKLKCWERKKYIKDPANGSCLIPILRVLFFAFSVVPSGRIFNGWAVSTVQYVAGAWTFGLKHGFYLLILRFFNGYNERKNNIFQIHICIRIHINFYHPGPVYGAYWKLSIEHEWAWTNSERRADERKPKTKKIHDDAVGTNGN